MLLALSKFIQIQNQNQGQQGGATEDEIRKEINKHFKNIELDKGSINTQIQNWWYGNNSSTVDLESQSINDFAVIRLFKSYNEFVQANKQFEIDCNTDLTTIFSTLDLPEGISKEIVKILMTQKKS